MSFHLAFIIDILKLQTYYNWQLLMYNIYIYIYIYIYNVYDTHSELS